MRSTSTQILAEVQISLVRRSLSTFKNFPRALPMPINALMCQKCRGRLYSFTHIGILETTMVFGSNSGNHDVKKRPALPQNHGPSFNVYSLSLTVQNLTMKKPFEHKCISQGIEPRISGFADQWSRYFVDRISRSCGQDRPPQWSRHFVGRISRSCGQDRPPQYLMISSDKQTKQILSFSKYAFYR